MKSNNKKSPALTLEGNLNLANFYTDDAVNIWHLIRYKVLFQLVYVSNDLVNAHHLSKKQQIRKILVGLSDICYSLFKSPLTYLRNRKSRQDIKYIFVSTGVVNQRNEDGTVSNVLHDSFAQKIGFDACLFIEDMHQFTVSTPRVAPHVTYSTFPVFLSKLAGLLKYKITTKDKNVIDRLLKEVEHALPPGSVSPSFRLYLSTFAEKRLAEARMARKLYNRIFSRFSPSVIFLEDACYGNKLGVLLAARDKNIPIVEPQHGLINNFHLAYNFGAVYQENSMLKSHLPDYLLTFGPYFSDSVHVPFKRVSIGNPFLEMKRRSIPEKKNLYERATRVLCLSSGGQPESVNQLLELLADWCKANRYSLKFRCHPSEREKVKEIYPVVVTSQIMVSTVPSVIDDIIESDIVISEYSTTVFETLAMKKPVFLFKNKFYDIIANDFNLIPIVELDNLIATLDKYLNTTIDADAIPFNKIFDDNWEENFSRFMKTTLKQVG